MSTESPDVGAVRAAVERVRDRIAAAGGDPERVTVVAVTKGHGAAAARSALAAGVSDLGENYAQELLAKAPAVGSARWHFIGGLQRNKARSLAPVVSCWQTVDRDSLAVELGRRAPGAVVLVQVNLTDQPQRGGAAPADVPELVARCRGLGLDVAGLMAVGPPGGPELARPGFALVRQLADTLGLAELSMGMSDDLEVAVAHGATMVRVGSALFGSRPHQAHPEGPAR